MKPSTQQYLTNLADSLVNKNNKQRISLNRSWTKQFPKEAGVYALFEGRELVYTGETCSLKERMLDILNSRHHTVRRKIGAFNFSKVRGFSPASSKIKFPDHIEKLVIDWMENKVTLCYVEVTLGRKELEEFIQNKYNPKYNSERKRGAN
jgi:hypothetical protein